MRTCQVEAITGLEQSFAKDQPRALIHMATGAGKTFTVCAFTYRLIKYARARRVLFLVDRANLGEQARDEFHRYRTPDTNRLFTELCTHPRHPPEKSSASSASSSPRRPVHPPTRLQRAVDLAPVPGIVLTGTTTTMNLELKPIRDSIGLVLPEETLAVGLSFPPALEIV